MKPKLAERRSNTARPGKHTGVLDNSGDRLKHAEHGKYPEPSVCPDCGAVYHLGRWQWMPPPVHAAPQQCAACWRIKDHKPAGYILLEGTFAVSHRDEILSLIRNLEQKEKSEHPLQRIMDIGEQDSYISVTTTDLHLARGIGEALRDAYKGELESRFDDAACCLNVRWRR